MEYVEGQTLKATIEEGPLAIDAAVEIALKVAEGLSKAHTQDIVHRDIKSANIMTTAGGRVKIMDLGLAEMYHRLGREEHARERWETEIERLEAATSPVFKYDLELYRALCFAGLGRKHEAIQLASEALRNAPLEVDALLGTYRMVVAALVFVRTGAYEKAIDQLERLLSVPSVTSPALYRLDPAWDPLRDNPRFQRLVED
jgi:serine/threonine protein kinase